jgi:hypothetical protein
MPQIEEGQNMLQDIEQHDPTEIGSELSFPALHSLS